MTAPSIFLLAQSAEAPAGGGIFGGPLPMIVLMFVMMYFIIIRPQRKRQKEQESMQTGLKTGDQVITIGGVHGTVSSVRERTVMVRIAENVKVEVDKTAIATVKQKSDVVDVPATPAK